MGIVYRVFYAGSPSLRILLANPKGDRKGPRSTPLLSRPYKDAERFHQQYLEEPLHLFQKFCKTIVGIFDSFCHATLEHAVAVSD